MTVQPEDLQPFVNGAGPVHVVHEDGSAVSYAPSARLGLSDSSRMDAWTVDLVELTLLDEQSRPMRAIAGDQIVKIEVQSVGYKVIVESSEKSDPGNKVVTRGA